MLWRMVRQASGPLVKRLSDGWYYRRGSTSSYPWIGPFVTEHVARQVREHVTGGPWGTRSHARVIHQEPTSRPVFAEHERDHHITTSGRRALTADQFALPPGPEEKRRGIKGRLPIDTLKRARNALTRAAQMHKHRHISAGMLAEAKRKVHRAWPSIEIGA
jgi:hypothetical protein